MQVHKRGDFESERGAIDGKRDEEGAQRVVLWAQGSASLSGRHVEQMFVVRAQSVS